MSKALSKKTGFKYAICFLQNGFNFGKAILLLLCRVTGQPWSQNNCQNLELVIKLVSAYPLGMQLIHRQRCRTANLLKIVISQTGKLIFFQHNQHDQFHFIVGNVT